MTPTGGSSPASNKPCSTPTCAAPRAPPPPSTHVRRAGPKMGYVPPPIGGRNVRLPLPCGERVGVRGGRWDTLGAFVPGRQGALMRLGLGLALECRPRPLETD